jgi:nitronate monooxygenase
MWTTKLNNLLTIKFPIIQGPFGGGLSSVELAARVSNLGGLGSFGAQPLTAEEIIETNSAIKKLTDKPYAINLWVNDRDERLSTFKEKEYEKLKQIFKPYFDELKVQMPEIPVDFGAKYEDQIEALLKVRPPVFSFVNGIPSKEVLSECDKNNIKTIVTATTVDEAIELEKAGVDAIVATGFEAADTGFPLFALQKKALWELFH